MCKYRRITFILLVIDIAQILEPRENDKFTDLFHNKQIKMCAVKKQCFQQIDTVIT